MMIRLSLRSRLRSAIAVGAMVGLVGSSILPASAQVYTPAPVPGAMPVSAAAGGAEQTQGWPREIPAPQGLRVLMYQPQIDSWDSHRLQSRAALSVGGGPGGDLSYGVAYFTARTDIDKTSRQVFLHDVQVTKLDMPGDPQLVAPVKAALERQWAGATRTVSLDRLQASLAASQAGKDQQQSVEVNNDPPNILFTTTPSVLVLIDGAPSLQPVLNSRYERVINTNALVLKHSTAGRFYLRVAGLWAAAPSLEGPWTIERAGLGELDAIKKAALAQAQVDILDDDDQPGLYGVLPAIYISSAAAELLQSDGEPQYAPIDGTRLLYVANSVSDIFVDTGSQEFFVLISGRWFRARGVDGPWAYVDSAQLPADFRRIPEEHPKGDVLASIAGTPQAREAAIANAIPQSATVDRQAPVTYQPVYDGAAQFQPVEGTPLYYAVNAPMPVVRVDPNSYYSVYNGVWYTAPTPAGPWIVAYVVPPVIYTIPPRSPIYYATYVRVYSYSPRYVYVGYTPGYFGTYVTPHGTVVYGAGYRYRPWVGQAYYSRPASYGYGAAFVSGGFAGFALGLATAAIVSAPYWGPYWGWHHDSDRRAGSREADRRDGRRDGDWRGQRNFSSNVYTQTNTTNTTVIVNNYNAPAPPGASAQTQAQRSAAQPQQQQTSQRERERERRAEEMRRDSQAYRESVARNRAGQPAQGQAAPGQAAPAPAGQAQPRDRNDVFVGADGKVYRRGEQGWERNERNRWTPTDARRVAAPAATPAGRTTPAPATPAVAAPQRTDDQRRQGAGPSATGQTGLNRADEAAGARGQQGRDQARAAQEKAAADKAAADKAAAEKSVQGKAVQDKAAQDKAAADRAASGKAAQDRAAAQQRDDQDKANRDKAARDKAVQDKATQDRATQDKAAQERARAESQRRQDQARPAAPQPAPRPAAVPAVQPAPQPAARPAPQPAPQAAARPAPAPAPSVQAPPQPAARPAPPPAPQAAAKPAPAPAPKPAAPGADETKKKLEAERAARALGEAQSNANRNRPAPDAFVQPDRAKRNGRGSGG